MSKKIYINAGHSDKDSGAVGYETERVLNVKVSNYMEQHLLAHYDCEVKQSSGSVDSLTAIANDANSWGADLFVSNHFNAGGGDGFEVFVYSDARVPLGKLFAKHVAAVGQNLRISSVAEGVKIRPTLAVLSKTHMPAVLNEGAFVDNKKDIADWNDDAELQALGAAYAKAAAEYLGLPAKVAAENKQQDAAAETAGVIWRVQVGAYADYNNAVAQVKKLKAAGFNAIVVKKRDGE